MKRILLSLLLIPPILTAQQVINVEYPSEGSIVLSDKVILPKIKSGYTLWLAKERSKGMIVFFNGNRDTINKPSIIDLALKNQLAVLFVTTNNQVEFLFEESKMKELEGYVYEAISKNKIPKDNMLYCGMSLAGTRALKLAAFSQTEQSTYKLIPKAIAICDAPLDMVRNYHECKKASDLNLNPIGASESEWVSSYIKSNLKGTPEEVLTTYINYSPFCYTAENGGNAKAFKNIYLRCYTEPDVNWWIENRGRDYYGMNAIDLAALVNQLKILGSKKTELITTAGKGFREDGSRHPHSWSIVDENELVEWFTRLPSDKKSP
ncbi:MAG TPA: hypothetical protein VNM35_00655 [Chitinophagaceae bacterium]|jgi:hypothetical protein|nr:hypothetical protein [Chitinophagaceae bacterium]